MHNIYEETIKKVEQGSRFSVNFQQRSLKIDGKYVIKNGKYEGECEIEQDGYSLEIITQLFVRYHHSVPSERSVSKRKNYFIALPEQNYLMKICFMERHVKLPKLNLNFMSC